MKIYDCFQFFNELDLLEIRLNILNDYVDYFILTESTVTFSGFDKPLYYQENKNRFKQFNDKIIHVIVDNKLKDFESAWDREIFQRNYPIKILNKHSNLDDIVITSDLDEIPNPEILENINDFFDINSLYHCSQKNYAYYLNNMVDNSWYGSRICSFSYLKKRSINDIRESTENKNNLTGFIIENGGWHFTSLGGKDMVKQKIESFSHQEFNTESIKHKISKSIEQNIDIFGRSLKFKYVDIDETFPQYIKNNIKNYSHLIK